MKRRLFANEKELRSLGNITLTTHRVIVYTRCARGETSTAVLLDHVQWTQMTSGLQREALSVAIALVVVGSACLLDGPPSLGGALTVAGLLLGVLVFVWRPTIMVIGAGSGRIEAWMGGAKERRRQTRSFLDAIDHAAARDGTATLGHSIRLPREPPPDATR